MWVVQSRSGSREGGESRRGGALVLILIVVLTIGGLSAGLLQLSGAVTSRQASTVNTKLAFYMAEAGLAEAYGGLVIGKTGNVGSPEQPASFGDGLFWVTATDNADGTVTLESTGMVANGRAVLAMVVEPQGSSAAILGIFSDRELDLQPGVRLDGWDSSEGPYERGTRARTAGSPTATPATSTALGRVGSNGRIQVSGTPERPTVIVGDVTPGPGRQLVTTEDVTITGSEQPALAAVALPPVELPLLPQLPGIEHSAGVPRVIFPVETGIGFLRVLSDSEVIVQGPSVLVLGQLQVQDSGVLTLDASAGSIHLYVTDELELTPESFVNVIGEDPSRVVLQVEGLTAEPVQLGATARFHGIIYAPEAEVRVSESFELFGALVAGGLQLRGASQLHFDRYIDELASELALPRLISWRIVALGTPREAFASMDPFRFLGVDESSCENPAKSHGDVFLKLDYRDRFGVGRSYAGPENAFDWMNVQSIDSIERDGMRIKLNGRGVQDPGSGGGGMFTSSRP